MKGDAFGKHAAWAAAVSLVGAGVAAFVPAGVEDRRAAFLGVGLAALSGALALVLKRRVMGKDLKFALKVLGITFGLRAVLVAGGLWATLARKGGPMAFVLGFFGVYFVLQWIEISYVVAASKAASGDE